MAVVAALAAALWIQSEAHSVSASEADAAAVITADTSAPASLETASAEIETLRTETGEVSGSGAEASMVNVLESARSEGRGFSVFCISMAVSLTVMLGIFSLMLRKKKKRSR